MEKANVVFGNTKVNLTSQGMRELPTSLNNQLQLLSKIAETKPQSTHVTFVSGFICKLTYFICIIPNSELLLPLEHTIL